MESENLNSGSTAFQSSSSGSEAVSEFLIELNSRPQTGPRGYYFPWTTSANCYDKTSYNPVYSAGKVTQRDIDVLVADVETHPMHDPTAGEASLVIWIFVIFFAMVIACGLIIGYGDMSTDFWKIFLAMGIGMVLIIAVIICGSMRQRSRLRDRRDAMDQIMRKHNETTFAGKGAMAKMSNLGSYIAIEFTFDAYQPIGNLYQQNLPMYPAAGYYSPAQPNPYGNANQYPMAGGYNQIAPMKYN